MTPDEKKALEESIINSLKSVYDPEIPVDIYELGLIYDVVIHDDASVYIKMTLTSPACPVAGTLPGEVEQKVAGVQGVKSAKVEITFEGEVDPKMGWLFDHAEISRVMRPIVEQLDHVYLNEVPGLENPTIENLAAWIWRALAPKLPGLVEIVVHETPTARCAYRGE